MEQLHFITKLLDIKDPNIKIMSLIWIPTKKSSLNWIMKPQLAIISEVKWRNMIFKNRLRFLILKRLVCLPESSLESAVSSAIIAHQLAILTSTVIRKLNDFHFKHDFNRFPEIMSWDVETVRGVTVSIGKWRWVLLLKILTNSISPLFLKEEHKPSFEITFCATIELSSVG